jgi:hypothetical protein
MKVIVFTAVMGDWLEVHCPKVVNPDVGYYLFTDYNIGGADPWNVRLLQTTRGGRYHARRIKINSFDHLPQHDWSLWVDSRFTLNINPVPLVNQLEEAGAQLAAMEHPDRSSLKDEVEEIVRLSKAPEIKVRRQLQKYQSLGWDKKVNRLTSSGFLLRKNTASVREFNRLWWREVSRWTLRDQMCLDICVERAGIEVYYLEGNYRSNPYAKWKKERCRR